MVHVMIDLHTHSNASDGSYSPTKLVALAKQAGVSVLSLTDHDTVKGVEEARIAADAINICFIPGIEISVSGYTEMHILGYGIDTSNDALNEMCENFKRFREERKYKIIEHLNKRGIIISAEDVEKYSKNNVGRPHFARVLLAKGYVSSIREAFDRYLTGKEFQKIERPKPPPDEGIRLITQASGAAVLAHPSSLKLNSTELDKLVGELSGYGLCGIECFYSGFTAGQTAEYLGLAQKYDLLITGGTDFHGEDVKPDIQLGKGMSDSSVFTDMGAVEKLKGYVGK